MCRECIRNTPFKDKIVLSRENEHYIFSIETTGSIPVEELFTRV